MHAISRWSSRNARLLNFLYRRSRDVFQFIKPLLPVAVHLVEVDLDLLATLDLTLKIFHERLHSSRYAVVTNVQAETLCQILERFGGNTPRCVLVRDLLLVHS